MAGTWRGFDEINRYPVVRRDGMQYMPTETAQFERFNSVTRGIEQRFCEVMGRRLASVKSETGRDALIYGFRCAVYKRIDLARRITDFSQFMDMHMATRSPKDQ